MSDAPRRAFPTERALAAVAAVLAVLAFIAREPTAASLGGVDVPALARIVEHESGDVTALEVARWIREGRRGLRVVDLRSATEYDGYHIPGAESLSLTELSEGRFAPDETVVLYDEDGTQAATGRLLLRAAKVENVYFVVGGLTAWIEQVIEATLASSASPAERTAFEDVAELSRYFGGTPRILEPGDELRATGDGRRPTSGTQAVNAVARVRRRGC